MGPPTRGLPPRHSDAQLLAHPGRDGDVDPRATKAGQHAYTASKLCAVLTTRALAAQPETQARHLTILSYCPGQVFGTGLATDLSMPRRVGWSLLRTPLSRPLRRFVPTLNTRVAAGSALAELALGLARPPTGRTYAALRRGQLTWPDPSALARSDEAAQALWHDSARLVGLPS